MKTLRTPHLTRTQRTGLGGAALLALGIAAGGGAVSLTRSPVEMAPTVPTAISSLSSAHGIVSVRGRVAAIYGDRFLVQDQTGRALVDAGHGRTASLDVGSPVLVQGRFGDGQLHARFLVDASGAVQEVGPPPHGGPGGPPPRSGPGAPPPPPFADGPAPPPVAPSPVLAGRAMAQPAAPATPIGSTGG